MQHVKLIIDGITVEVRAGTLLIDAARKAGVHIPTICSLRGQPAREVCRLCSVSVTDRQGLIPACATVATPGMEVDTQGPAVLKARRVLIELALAEHGPCDMNTCGGEQNCQLNRLAREHGITDRRFATIEKPTRKELSSESIQVQFDGCILCDRCILACRDLHIIGRAGRGGNTRIVFDADAEMGESNCVTCGDCVAVCPAGVFK